jgi:hypothetical protein
LWCNARAVSPTGALREISGSSANYRAIVGW